MTRNQNAPKVVVRLAIEGIGVQKLELPVLGAVFRIGRDEACQLRPRYRTVSRHHAEISIEGESVFLRDLGSMNGTYLSGERVTTIAPVYDGDRIEIEPLSITVSVGPPGGPVKPSVDPEDQAAEWLMEGRPAQDSNRLTNGQLGPVPGTVAKLAGSEASC